MEKPHFLPWMPSKYLPLSREVRQPLGCQAKCPPQARLMTLKSVALTSKQHPVPAAPPTLLHLRAAPTLHSDTASTLPYSQSQLLLPGEWPVPRCTTGDGSLHANPGCPGRPAPADPGS